MAQNFKHVSHKKSNLIRNIVPEEFYGLTPTADNSEATGSSPIKLNLAKRPTPEQLIEGEIAVNYKKAHETLSIKNDNDEIVGFVNENDFNEAQEIVALGLAQEKNERISDIAKLESKISDEIVDKIEGFDNNVERLELGISSALNDLNLRTLNNEDAIENLSEEIEHTISSSINDLNGRINETNEDIDNKYSDLTEQVTTLENEVHYNGRSKYIDLGLPSGVLWGRYNLPIAFNPADQYTNLYFAWAETEGYEECELGVNRSFDNTSYKWKWGQIDNNTPTTEPLKYNSSDSKTHLELQNDAASANWGWSWRLPSKEEVQELIDYTTCTYDGNNGGFFIFTSNINGEKLYVPCAGIAGNTSVSGKQAEAYFWTRDVAESDKTKAYALRCLGQGPSIRTIGRELGLPIRPVTHKRTRQ